jgi:hypothetical protein
MNSVLVRSLLWVVAGSGSIVLAQSPGTFTPAGEQVAPLGV